MEIINQPDLMAWLVLVKRNARRKLRLAHERQIDLNKMVYASPLSDEKLHALAIKDLDLCKGPNRH